MHLTESECQACQRRLAYKCSQICFDIDCELGTESTYELYSEGLYIKIDTGSINMIFVPMEILQTRDSRDILIYMYGPTSKKMCEISPKIEYLYKGKVYQNIDEATEVMEGDFDDFRIECGAVVQDD